MPVPLHEAGAELFRTLGHPARIRILELLEHIDTDASNLSQQLAVLRRAPRGQPPGRPEP